MQISGGSRLICIISSIFDEKPRLNYFYPHQELRDSRENVTKYQVNKDSNKMWFCHGCKFDESNCQCSQLLATFLLFLNVIWGIYFSQWRLSSKLGMLSWGNSFIQHSSTSPSFEHLLFQSRSRRLFWIEQIQSFPNIFENFLPLPGIGPPNCLRWLCGA